MEAKGFFSSLFDYSFSSFVTPRIIKVLYVLSTIAIALWTLGFIGVAFKVSSGAGILALLIGGSLFFIISMIYVRVGLELLIAFFRIHANVEEINTRDASTAQAAPGIQAPPAAPGPGPALA